MEALLLIGILLLNGVISWMNCRAAGYMWRDTMAVGSFFDKILLWCAAIQSSVGFSMLYMVPLGFIGIAFMSSGEKPMITPEEGSLLLKEAFSLWYIAVIFPVLGSGTIIWIHSLREAYRRRDWPSMLGAGWNTFAQLSNMYSAYKNVGSAFADSGNLLSSISKIGSGGNDSKGKAALVMVMLVVLSLVGGVITTIMLIRYYASKATSVVLESDSVKNLKRKSA